MKKYSLSILFIAILFFVLFASTKSHAQLGWKWGIGATQPDSTCYDEESSTIDTKGNLLMAAIYAGGDSITIANTTTVHFPDYNSYLMVTKTDSAGHLLWFFKAKKILNVIGIVTDDTGNVYVAGNYDTSLYIGSLHLIAPVGGSGYLLKLSPSGSPIWARNISLVSTMNIDNANNIYLAGPIYGALTLDGITIGTAGGNYSVFLEKFTPAGTLIWLKGILGGSCVNYLNDATVSENGTIYVNGYFSPTSSDTSYWHMAIGSYTLTVPNTAGTSSNCFYITKLDSSGHVEWAHYQNDSSYILDMTTDKEDNLFTTGYFRNTVTVGHDTLASHGMLDMFVSRFDSSGRILWTNSAGGEHDDYGFEISIDRCGTLWAGGAIGYYMLTWPDSNYIMDFGGGHLLNALPHSNDAIWFARYDTSGNYLASVALQSGGDDWFCLLPDKRGNLYVGGDFYRTTLNLAGSILVSPDTNSEYLFIGKYKYDQSECYQVTDTIAYIKQAVVPAELIIYPNPTQQQITVVNNEEIAQLIITNLLGQEMINLTPNTTTVNVDLTNLPSGVYLLKVNGHDVRKVLKE